MFIDHGTTLTLAPFEGAEDNWISPLEISPLLRTEPEDRDRAFYKHLTPSGVKPDRKVRVLLRRSFHPYNSLAPEFHARFKNRNQLTETY
jgi:hypothetical protein